MLTNDKIKGLSIFMHSRLSGKYTSKDLIKGSVIDDEVKSKELYIEIQELIKDLEDQKLTVDDLSLYPESYYKQMIIHYYDVALKEMERYIKSGEEMIEGVIALSILSYILQEKQVANLLTDKTPSDLMEFFEKSDSDRRLVYKMIDVGTKIVEAVQKANYTLYIKKTKKRTKSRKRR